MISLLLKMGPPVLRAALIVKRRSDRLYPVLIAGTGLPFPHNSLFFTHASVPPVNEIVVQAQMRDASERRTL
jgi:hypothetical protein